MASSVPELVDSLGELMDKANLDDTRGADVLLCIIMQMASKAEEDGHPLLVNELGDMFDRALVATRKV